VEWIVGTFVVLGFIAIILRFMPRDPAGRVRLPPIVDDSIGMWALRRLTGRPMGGRTEDVGSSTIDPAITAHQAAMARAATIRAAAAARATAGRATSASSSRFLASRSRLEAIGIPPAGRARASMPTKRPHVPIAVVSSSVRRNQAHPTGSLAVQQRLTGLLAILVVAVIAIVVAVFPRAASGLGGVLAETGQPGDSGPNQGAASGPIDQPSDARAATAPEFSPLAPAASATMVPVARATPRPTARATAAPTARPTPKPTPRPTSSPLRTTGPAATSSIPVPTPTPSAAPSAAPS
jgi:hypothetical protein